MERLGVQAEPDCGYVGRTLQVGVRSKLPPRSEPGKEGWHRASHVLEEGSEGSVSAEHLPGRTCCVRGEGEPASLASHLACRKNECEWRVVSIKYKIKTGPENSLSGQNHFNAKSKTKFSLFHECMGNLDYLLEMPLKSKEELKPSS